jgi:carbon monoxide dehydrogenase subunit G
MKMTGERLLPVPPQQAWDALNDPAMLKDCIPGCESVTLTEPQRYELVMAAKIGPVSARFRGRLTQSDVVEPRSYSIQFDGQGGAAGFGKGTAAVRLAEAEGGTRLDYDVSAQIGGKLAQIGSRLVDAAARKIAEEFFGNFEERLRERAAGSAPTGAAALPGEPSPPGTTLASPESGPEAQPTVRREPSAPPGDGAPRRPDESLRNARTTDAEERDNRARWLMWALVLAAAAALMIWLGR